MYISVASGHLMLNTKNVSKNGAMRQITMASRDANPQTQSQTI